MSVFDGKASFRPHERRHPRLVQRTSWLRHHANTVALIAAACILVVFVLDVTAHPITMAGFYLVPLTLLALSGRERLVALAGIVCLGLTLAVMAGQQMLGMANWFNVLYGAIAGASLVILAYLIRRLTMISDYASLRAQLSEAGADIFAGGSNPEDLDELLEYALERLGEQLDASSGVVLVLEDGLCRGRAGFGLGVDARNVVGDAADSPLAFEALNADAPLLRDLTTEGADRLGALAGHVSLERVLLVPMVALERRVGTLVYTRPQVSGDYSGDQVSLAESIGRYLAVAIDNARLLTELETRRRDLEVINASSLDFAQRGDTDEILRAVALRLITVLDMDNCDIYEVDGEAGVLRALVSWENGEFDTTDWIGREFALDYFASSELAITRRRPVIITSPDDPRLNEVEREEFVRCGHKTQLGIPLRISDRVLALVELFDDREVREFSNDQVDLARTICRFAALAIDKARLFEQQRATTERRDRLARRLQRLQSFAIDLNQRLDMADPLEVLDEVAHAALDLLHVRAAAVVSGAGDYVAPWALEVAGDEEDAAELLRRCGRALALSDADELMADQGPPRVVQSDGLMLAPLQSETAVTGTLVVGDKLDGSFDDEDELLLATLAAQARVSLHNATAYQREHAIAETFQTALLMEAPPIPGIEVGVVYRASTEASRVGGDFYDLVMLGPTRLLVIVGDVCGKSLSAAAESAVVRYMLRAYAAEGSPGEALARLNSAMIDQMPSQPFVTLVVAYVDVARHMFEYAVAGHPRPVILAGHNDFPVTDEGHLPVGIFRGVPYPTNRAILPDDSCVVLYTDGMTDARRDGVMFGERRLHDAIKANLNLSAQDLAEQLLETVKDYAGGVLADDCAVVAIKLP